MTRLSFQTYFRILSLSLRSKELSSELFQRLHAWPRKRIASFACRLYEKTSFRSKNSSVEEDLADRGGGKGGKEKMKTTISPLGCTRNDRNGGTIRRAGSDALVNISIARIGAFADVWVIRCARPVVAGYNATRGPSIFICRSGGSKWRAKPARRTRVVRAKVVRKALYYGHYCSLPAVRAARQRALIKCRQLTAGQVPGSEFLAFPFPWHRRLRCSLLCSSVSVSGHRVRPRVRWW